MFHLSIASDREKFWIAAAYDTLVTGNMEEAQQTCEAWAQTYPREAPPHMMLSGMVNKTTGQYARANDSNVLVNAGLR